jgi:hypothetical protein
MPSIRSIAFKYYIYTIILILLFSKIMPTYSYYIKKGLVYIIIIALFSYQPSSYFNYTKLNIYLSCNIRSISKNKYIYFYTLFNTY